MTKTILAGFAGVLLLVSCSDQTAAEFEKPPKVKDADLQLVLDSLSDQHVSTFYSKISTKYSDTNRNLTMKNSVKIFEDSVINILSRVAGVPVLNALITPDSVLMSVTAKKCYMKQNLGLLKEEFGVEFAQKDVEDLFLGLPVGYDPELKYYQWNTDVNGYVMCSHRKKDIKRNERKDKREIITTYIISRDLKELEEIQIESPEDTASIRVAYKSRELIDSMMLPKEVEMTISTPRNNIFIRLTYKKTRINGEEQYVFVIPEKYEVCE
jgi:hypothetical protein